LLDFKFSLPSKARSEVHQLRKDLQLAVKALQMELGEDMPVSRVLSGQSEWRGRAEQISLLRAKVAELQKQVKPSSRSSEANRPTVSSPNKSDDRNRTALRSLELQRKQTLELASIEQQKHEAIKARNRCKNLFKVKL
jgi:hypothetical protein